MTPRSALPPGDEGSAGQTSIWHVLRTLCSLLETVPTDVSSEKAPPAPDGNWLMDVTQRTLATSDAAERRRLTREFEAHPYFAWMQAARAARDRLVGEIRKQVSDQVINNRKALLVLHVRHAVGGSWEQEWDELRARDRKHATSHQAEVIRVFRKRGPRMTALEAWTLCDRLCPFCTGKALRTLAGLLKQNHAPAAVNTDPRPDDLQFAILAELEKAGGSVASVSKLAKMVMTDRTTVSKRVGTMRKLNLLAPQVAARKRMNGGRGDGVGVTKKGLATLGASRKLRRQE